MVTKRPSNSAPSSLKQTKSSKTLVRRAISDVTSTTRTRTNFKKAVAGPDAKGKRVLILDDEPEYLTWVVEFLEAQNLSVEFVTNLSDAFRAISQTKYRLLLVDMNVPPGTSISPRLRTLIDSVDTYPGLALALEARNFGYGAHSVVAYTVHDDERIAQDLNRWHCRYVLKGRPDIFKSVVRASLTPAPE